MSSVTELATHGGQSPEVRLPFNLTQLLAFAMQKPRDPMRALDNALTQLRAAPQFAKAAYYTLPFKDKEGKQTDVIGPSIKAATALTGCWGNNVEGAFIGQETADYVDVQGYFFDYETGKMTIRPQRVSKIYKTKNGDVVPWRHDMLQRQIAVGVSKAIRNADINGLPAGYVAAYFEEAKRLAARGGNNPDKTNPDKDIAMIRDEMKKIVAGFEAIGVERPEIEAYINRRKDLNSEEAVVAHLIGVLASIQDGEANVDEIFAVPDQSEPLKAPKPAAPFASKPAQAPKAASALPPVPTSGRVMNSKKSGKCATCGEPINEDTAIIFDTQTFRAHHRAHYA